MSAAPFSPMVTLVGAGPGDPELLTLKAVKAIQMATVLLVDDCAKALVGNKLDDATLAKLDAAAQAACKPINDKRGTVEFRTKIAGVLARRTAAIAFDRAMGKSTAKAH
mgnify:CR=1 FL=1